MFKSYQRNITLVLKCIQWISLNPTWLIGLSGNGLALKPELTPIQDDGA